MRQKNLLWKDNEANAWRSNYFGQTYVGYIFLQQFHNSEKISLNWRLDSTVTDYAYNYDNRFAYFHCDTTLINNEPLKIYVHPT